jgi:hypothetical protein
MLVNRQKIDQGLVIRCHLDAHTVSSIIYRNASICSSITCIKCSSIRSVVIRNRNRQWCKERGALRHIANPITILVFCIPTIS